MQKKHKIRLLERKQTGQRTSRSLETFKTGDCFIHGGSPFILLHQPINIPKDMRLILNLENTCILQIEDCVQVTPLYNISLIYSREEFA